MSTERINSAVTAAPVQAVEVQAKAQRFEKLNIWTYQTARDTFNAANNVENRVAYGAAKIVCAVAAAFVAVVQTLGYVAGQIANVGIWAANGINNLCTSEKPVAALLVTEQPVATPAAEVVKEAAKTVEEVLDAAVEAVKEEEEKVADLVVPTARSTREIVEEGITNGINAVQAKASAGCKVVKEKASTGYDAVKAKASAAKAYVMSHKAPIAGTVTGGAAFGYATHVFAAPSAIAGFGAAWAGTAAIATGGLLGAAALGLAARALANRQAQVAV